MKNKSGYIFAIMSAGIFGFIPLMTKYFISIDLDFISSSFYRMSLWLITIFYNK
ncbi:hypothetical protein [uncultured Peptoniphilus sp.]|uniref:hypothetical protein n=1 Tax=uncultured Peptoniphilus sp. TaxID=254354 RepID=UPI00280632EC|nr:hypothetical protein [uncultured Peptoniphilus sp.]